MFIILIMFIKFIMALFGNAFKFNYANRSRWKNWQSRLNIKEIKEKHIFIVCDNFVDFTL